MMRRYWLAAAMMCAGAGVGAARAQVAVYGQVAYVHDSDPSGNTSRNFYGGTVGVSDNFLHAGPLRAGLDLRGSLLTGDNLRYRSLLGGVRVSAHVPVVPFRPYAEFLVGVGGTESTSAKAAGITSSAYNNKFTYEGLVGLDFTVFPHVDLRLPEVGIARMTGVNGSPANNPSDTLVSVSAGVVVRF